MSTDYSIKMINDNKVQIHRKSGIEDDDYYELTIDGYVVEGVQIVEIQSSQLGQQKFVAYSRKHSSSDRLSSLEIGDFIKANLFSISFENWTEVGIFSIDVAIEVNTGNEKSNLQINLLADLLLWNRNYTFVDYFHEFERLLNVNGIGELSDNGVGNNIFVKIEIPLQNRIIKEEINPNLEKLVENHYETLENLDSEHSDNAFLALFNFPQDLKVPCEQYLLYFAQFLQDLGISATSNLKEEAGKVLFSVTPTDDVEALDKIREALAIYLNLPSSPIVYDESFAAMRLKQQVDNLQHAQRMTEMEFRLAQKVIESQDKIIQQKDSTIEQQSKVIEMITDKAVMINSAENKEELEEIFDGIKVGKSKFLVEQIGLHLNPATALKSVGKKLIGREDGIISLNLNDEREII